MKSTIVCILLFIFFKISAQIEKPIHKSNIIIGGSFSLSTSNNTVEETMNTYENGTLSTNVYKVKSSNSNFSLSSNLGYFFYDGLALGITPTMAFTNQNTKSAGISGTTSTSHTNSIGSGVYIKYYFQKGVFMHLNLNYLYHKSSDTNHANIILYQGNGISIIEGTTEYKTNSSYSTLGLTPGLGYGIFLNSKYSLEFLISYFYQKRCGPVSSHSENTIIDSPNSNQNYSSSGTLDSNNNGIQFTIGFCKFL